MHLEESVPVPEESYPEFPVFLVCNLNVPRSHQLWAQMESWSQHQNYIGPQTCTSATKGFLECLSELIKDQLQLGPPSLPRYAGSPPGIMVSGSAGHMTITHAPD